MPYITKERREAITIFGTSLDSACISSPGELNYAVSVLCAKYLERSGLSYESVNAVIGVLACASHELYRRIAVPYEEEKIKQNGDVFDVDGLPTFADTFPNHADQKSLLKGR